MKKSFLTSIGVLCCASTVHAQLRVVQYNAGEVKTGLNTILEQIGHENVNGIAKPIDLLIVEEQAASTSVQNIVTVLNNIYGPGTYAMAPYVGISSGGGLPGVIYRPGSLSLVGSPVGIGTVNSSSNARQTIKYELLPVGYGADATLYLYASHFKASNGDTEAARRNVEAATNRANADAMGPGKNILYTGDLNLYSGFEAAYTTLTSAGNGQAIDPSGAQLNWAAGSRAIFTQSPATVQAYGGQVLGGMNDRFDFQLSSVGMNDANGLAFIPGSYRAFGNNGTQPFSGAANDPLNTWNNPGLTVPRTNVLNALVTASDHIPVVVDYQLPARMSVSLGAIAPRVISGAVLPVDVLVSNTAPVATSNGADELNYFLSSTGAVSGSVAGVATATLLGNSHELTFLASAPGAANGTVNVTATSQQTANGSFSQILSTVVVAHAKPSFSNLGGVASLTLDFGIRAKGYPAAIPFSLHNRADLSGFSAGLDLDAILESGNTSKLTTDLTPFSNLAPGSVNYEATLNTSVIGSSSANYTLLMSDEDIPGATGLSPLTLNLLGKVALGGDTNIDGIVDIHDLTTLAQNWQSTGDWSDGDFNNDGAVNITDLSMLAINYDQGQSLLPALKAMGLPITSIPEPASALAVGLMTLIGFTRRGRR